MHEVVCYWKNHFDKMTATLTSPFIFIHMSVYLSVYLYWFSDHIQPEANMQISVAYWHFLLRHFPAGTQYQNDVVSTSMRRDHVRHWYDVILTLCAHWVNICWEHNLVLSVCTRTLKEMNINYPHPGKWPFIVIVLKGECESGVGLPHPLSSRCCSIQLLLWSQIATVPSYSHWLRIQSTVQRESTFVCPPPPIECQFLQLLQLSFLSFVDILILHDYNKPARDLARYFVAMHWSIVKNTTLLMKRKWILVRLS